MIKEVIVVEGKNDIAAVKRAVDAECISTGGYALNRYTMEKISIAYDKRGIIILTDPDTAGERIRRKLTETFPEALQAFIAKEDASKNDDIGIEQASPDTIKEALAKVRTHSLEQSAEFSLQDIFANNLSGSENSSYRRNALGKRLGIGYTNAKGFLARLNNYGVSRQEFSEAVVFLDKGDI